MSGVPLRACVRDDDAFLRLRLAPASIASVGGGMGWVGVEKVHPEAAHEENFRSHASEHNSSSVSVLGRQRLTDSESVVSFRACVAFRLAPLAVPFPPPSRSGSPFYSIVVQAATT